MADDQAEAPAEAKAPPAPKRYRQKRYAYRFVGHRRTSNKTQRIAGPWGSVERGGPAVAIPQAALDRLTAVGYLFNREEVND